MSIQAVAWAIDQDLPARPKLVLIAIANHANHVDGYCWLKAETIAREAACRKRSVYNFIGALVRNGFIRKSLRKGEDGKQRATDYWILFGRPEKPWDPGAHLDPSEMDSEALESASTEGDIQDVVEPDAWDSSGENVQQEGRQPVDNHVYAPGPVASACHRHESLEPSKFNPRKDARASDANRPPSIPRSYKPPPVEPPQPMGAVVADKQAKQIFVFVGTRAWDAWVKVKREETGVSCWNLTTTIVENGRRRTGWWFPSLFPPSQTGPPDTLASEEDLDYFAKHG